MKNLKWRRLTTKEVREHPLSIRRKRQLCPFGSGRLKHRVFAPEGVDWPLVGISIRTTCEWGPDLEVIPGFRIVSNIVTHQKSYAQPYGLPCGLVDDVLEMIAEAKACPRFVTSLLMAELSL